MPSNTHGKFEVSELRYDLAQRILHWSMAAIIFVAIAIGLYCWSLPSGTPIRVLLLDVHKSLGMTALVLVVARLFRRVSKGGGRPMRNSSTLSFAPVLISRIGRFMS